MHESKKDTNGTILWAGVIVLIIITGLFLAAINYLLMSKLDQSISQTISYQDLPVKIPIPEEYVKAEYTIEVNQQCLPDNTNAISAEAAAGEGVRYLWEIFQFDVSHKIIYMMYAVDPSRGAAFWHGAIMRDGETRDGSNIPEYGFSIDAISGKWCSVSYEPELEHAEIIDYDEHGTTQYYKEHGEEFIALAKEYAAKQIQAEIVSAEVHGTMAWRAPGYIYEVPEWDEAMYQTLYGDTELIRIPYGEPMPVLAVGVIVYVTDAAGNQVEVILDSSTKAVTSINDLYGGVNYQPDGLG